METKQQKKLMIALFAVVGILALLVVYAFAVKPAINGYATKVYNQGVQDTVVTIMQQASSCSSSGVPLKYQNTTLNMVALQCYQSAQSANQSSSS